MVVADRRQLAQASWQHESLARQGRLQHRELVIFLEQLFLEKIGIARREVVPICISAAQPPLGDHREKAAVIVS